MLVYLFWYVDWRFAVWIAYIVPIMRWEDYCSLRCISARQGWMVAVLGQKLDEVVAAEV